MTSKPEIRIFETPTDVAAAASKLFRQAGTDAIQARNEFHVCLAGGSTPKAAYERIAQDMVGFPWSRVHIYFGDERTVPPAHEDSNYRMAADAMLASIPLPLENIHRIPAELSASTAAHVYDQTLHAHLADSEGRFDLVFLGMGTDGHTASLFPHTPALDETEKWCIANDVPTLETTRITLTYPILNAARRVAFLVTGSSKADVLHQVIHGPIDIKSLPSQGICAHGETIWMLDKAAASSKM